MPQSQSPLSDCISFSPRLNILKCIHASKPLIVKFVNDTSRRDSCLSQACFLSLRVSIMMVTFAKQSEHFTMYISAGYHASAVIQCDLREVEEVVHRCRRWTWCCMRESPFLLWVLLDVAKAQFSGPSQVCSFFLPSFLACTRLTSHDIK